MDGSREEIIAATKTLVETSSDSAMLVVFILAHGISDREITLSDDSKFDVQTALDELDVNPLQPKVTLSCILYQAPSIMHPILYLHYTYTIPTRHLHYLDEILVISGMLSLKGIVERRNQLDGKGARTVPVSSADSNRNIFIYDKSSLTFTH